tara:strand:+ start:3677 stop:3877 length:201 start_codon:yes stop_codon:yes gene_type:complete
MDLSEATKVEDERSEEYKLAVEVAARGWAEVLPVAWDSAGSGDVVGGNRRFWDWRLGGGNRVDWRK